MYIVNVCCIDLLPWWDTINNVRYIICWASHRVYGTEKIIYCYMFLFVYVAIIIWYVIKLAIITRIILRKYCAACITWWTMYLCAYVSIKYKPPLRNWDQSGMNVFPQAIRPIFFFYNRGESRLSSCRNRYERRGHMIGTCSSLHVPLVHLQKKERVVDD